MQEFLNQLLKTGFQDDNALHQLATDMGIAPSDVLQVIITALNKLLTVNPTEAKLFISRLHDINNQLLVEAVDQNMKQQNTINTLQEEVKKLKAKLNGN